MRPVAIVDRGEDGQHAQERHKIHNQTARAIGWLGLAALLIPCVATLLVYVFRRQDG
jgi:ABC-type nickel/cobalt efflux system permease component RcnA